MHACFLPTGMKGHSLFVGSKRVLIYVHHQDGIAGCHQTYSVSGNVDLIKCSNLYYHTHFCALTAIKSPPSSIVLMVLRNRTDG